MGGDHAVLIHTHRLRSPVGPMTAHEQHLEGELRYVNSRVITNSEEISFYQGNTRERLTIYSTFDQLVREGGRERLWGGRESGVVVQGEDGREGGGETWGERGSKGERIFSDSFQIEHLRSFVLFRFSMGFIDSMVAKCELTSLCCSVLSIAYILTL